VGNIFAGRDYAAEVKVIFGLGARRQYPSLQ
jgi:hypothetical protein